MNAYDIDLKAGDHTLHFHQEAETAADAITQVQAFARWRFDLTDSVITNWKECSAR